MFIFIVQGKVVNININLCADEVSFRRQRQPSRCSGIFGTMERLIRVLIPFVFFFALRTEAIAEMKSTGIPAIRNFPRKAYRASTQNWAVAQDYRGFMYFANNDGVLEFDGTTWELYQFAEPANTRSIATDQSGNLYTGMYNEFGKASADQAGRLTFTSFRRSLTAYPGDLGDIWKVFVTPAGIFFQGYSNLFQFDEEGVLLNVFDSPGKFLFSFYVGGELYIQETEKGLLRLNGRVLEPLPGLELIRDYEIRALLPGSGGSLVIGTAGNGVFRYTAGRLTPWNTKANQLLTSNQIFSSCLLPGDLFAFGTIQGGVVITSEHGEMIQHLNKSKGLQNNTVLSVASDRHGNLWMGLDNGIDYAQINSPLYFLHHQGGFGSGYAAAVHQGHLYLGTNNGLFAAPWPAQTPGEQPIFQLIENTVGQVWYLGVHEDILLCGHDKGAFQINGIKARKISDQGGVWKFIAMPQFPGKLISGNYLGLSVYRFDQKSRSWVFEKNIDGFSESSRVMETDREGNLWMTHGFKGAYKIRFHPADLTLSQYSYYNSENGFVTNYYINVFKVDGNPVFTAREGIFRYNPGRDFFERDTLLEKMFGTKEHLTYLCQDKTRNIWFIAGNRPGLLRFSEDGSYSLVLKPFELIYNKMLGGFEMIYPYSPAEIFFGIENGFAHYSPGILLPVNIPFRVFIRKFETPRVLVCCGDNQLTNSHTPKPVPNIPYRNNSVKINYSSPSFDGQSEIHYSYQLENHLDDWSEWTPTPFCEFSKLHEGIYTFYVKARDNLGHESDTDQITFRILPPWHRSRLARLIYIFLTLAALFLISRLILLRIEISRRKERLRQIKAYRSREQIYLRDALLAEKEIVSLRNEKLKESMIHKDKELANQTLHLIRKNKFLLKIKEELRTIENQAKTDVLKTRLALQIKKIDREIDNEKQWELFETAFDEVHEDFLLRLKQKFPNLTPREMRLCAYLKMNISTKEIAALMNISARGVEISRYRLRRKLGIGREINLTRFILDL